jgi:dTDP-4-amino-4,6-dideoxygalactose transaminase
MKVPYLDLSVNDSALKRKLLDAIEKVLTHGRVILGPEVEHLENKLAEYCGRKYAVGVSSGTDALYIALRALDIGPGDEVITTPMSWIATVNAIVMTGAVPVFVDIKPDLNINSDLISDAITPRTKAIIPVHYTGKMCDMDQVMEIADKYGLYVIEDAAQAFGARFKGRRAGSFGKIACFSMNSMKIFHSYGEAGALLTDDKAIKEKVIALRYNGTINRENCHYSSLNFRIQTVQAAMLLIELNRVDQVIERRREIAKVYENALKGIVKCPLEKDITFSVYYTYTIITDRRNKLKDFLTSKGIETKIHHPILMPYHAAYNKKFKTNIPVAERMVERILSIPNHEKMTDAEIKYVILSIQEFYKKGL